MTHSHIKNLQIEPRIGEPLLAGENPDLTADYIFCNNLWVKNTTVVGNPLVIGSHTDPGEIRILAGPTDNNTEYGDYYWKPRLDDIGIWTLGLTHPGSHWTSIQLFPSDPPPAPGSDPSTWVSLISGFDPNNSSYTTYTDVGINIGKRGSAPDVEWWQIRNGNCDVVFHASGDVGVSRNLITSYALATGGKPGPAVDADIPNPTNGMLRYDSTNNRLYVRIGGVWKYAALT